MTGQILSMTITTGVVVTARILARRAVDPRRRHQRATRRNGTMLTRERGDC